MSRFLNKASRAQAVAVAVVESSAQQRCSRTRLATLLVALLTTGFMIGFWTCSIQNTQQFAGNILTSDSHVEGAALQQLHHSVGFPSSANNAPPSKKANHPMKIDSEATVWQLQGLDLPSGKELNDVCAFGFFELQEGIANFRAELAKHVALILTPHDNRHVLSEAYIRETTEMVDLLEQQMSSVTIEDDSNCSTKATAEFLAGSLLRATVGLSLGGLHVRYGQGKSHVIKVPLLWDAHLPQPPGQVRYQDQNPTGSLCSDGVGCASYQPPTVYYTSNKPHTAYTTNKRYASVPPCYAIGSLTSSMQAAVMNAFASRAEAMLTKGRVELSDTNSVWQEVAANVALCSRQMQQPAVVATILNDAAKKTGEAAAKAAAVCANLPTLQRLAIAQAVTLGIVQVSSSITIGVSWLPSALPQSLWPVQGKPVLTQEGAQHLDALLAAFDTFFDPFASHNTWNPDSRDLAVRDADTVAVAEAARVTSYDGDSLERNLEPASTSTLDSPLASSIPEAAASIQKGRHVVGSIQIATADSTPRYNLQLAAAREGQWRGIDQLRVSTCQENALGSKQLLQHLLTLPPAVRLRLLHTLAIGMVCPPGLQRAEEVFVQLKKLLASWTKYNLPEVFHIGPRKSGSTALWQCIDVTRIFSRHPACFTGALPFSSNVTELGGNGIQASNVSTAGSASQDDSTSKINNATIASGNVSSESSPAFAEEDQGNAFNVPQDRSTLTPNRRLKLFGTQNFGILFNAARQLLHVTNLRPNQSQVVASLLRSLGARNPNHHQRQLTHNAGQTEDKQWLEMQRVEDSIASRVFNTGRVAKDMLSCGGNPGWRYFHLYRGIERRKAVADLDASDWLQTYTQDYKETFMLVYWLSRSAWVHRWEVIYDLRSRIRGLPGRPTMLDFSQHFHSSFQAPMGVFVASPDPAALRFTFVPREPIGRAYSEWAMAYIYKWDRAKYTDAILRQLPKFRKCYIEQIKRYSKSYTSPPSKHPRSYLAATSTISASNPHNLTRQEFLQLPANQQAQAALHDPGLLLMLPFPVFSRIMSACSSDNWRYAVDGFYPLHMHMWMQFFTPRQFTLVSHGTIKGMGAGQVLRYINSSLSYRIDPVLTEVIDVAQRENLSIQQIRNLLNEHIDEKSADPELMQALVQKVSKATNLCGRSNVWSFSRSSQIGKQETGGRMNLAKEELAKEYAKYEGVWRYFYPVPLANLEQDQSPEEDVDS